MKWFGLFMLLMGATCHREEARSCLHESPDVIVSDAGAWTTYDGDVVTDISGSEVMLPPHEPIPVWTSPPCGNVTLKWLDREPQRRSVVYQKGQCNPCVRGCTEIAQDEDRYTRERDGGEALLDGIVTCVEKCRKGER